jgi:hypothetical protein
MSVRTILINLGRQSYIHTYVYGPIYYNYGCFRKRRRTFASYYRIRLAMSGKGNKKASVRQGRKIKDLGTILNE